MTEMIRRCLRQKFGSIGIVIALAVLGILTATGLASSGGRSGFEPAFLGLVLLAAGSVSKDASGGALQMILARPIRRDSYLFGRYLGILVAYALFLAATGMCAILFGRLFSRIVTDFPKNSPLSPLLLGAGDALLQAILFAAVLLFFSTFLPGYADVLAYFLLYLLLNVPEAIGGALRKPWLSQASRIARENILPKVSWPEVLTGDHVLRAPTGRYALALTAFLFLASVIFARREFAYGQD